MKKFIIALGLILVLPTIVYSQERRITIDQTGWTMDQKVMFISMGYRIAFQNGENIVPKADKNVLVFQGLSEDTASKITATTLIDEFNEHTAEQAIAEANEATRVNNLKTSIRSKLRNGRGLTDAEIDFLNIPNLRD